jgi:hypothetical protein
MMRRHGGTCSALSAPGGVGARCASSARRAARAPPAAAAARAPAAARRATDAHCAPGGFRAPPRRRPLPPRTGAGAAPGVATAEAAAAAAAPPLRGFRLAPDEVQALLAARACSMDTLLLSLLEPAARLARPPVSNYHVG